MGWEMADENKQVPAPEPPRTEKEPKEKKPKKKHGCLFKILILVVIVIAIAVAATGVQNYQKENASYTWPSSGIAKVLPQPASNKGEILSNWDDKFSIVVRKTSQTDYSDYLAACKDKGFTVDSDSIGSSYSAFNTDGYKLELSYRPSSEEMSIDLTAPIKMDALNWPTKGAAALIPAPEATRGKIVTDSETTFTAYVGDMDTDAFNAYVESCIAAGYDVDYSRSDTDYSAKNADGAKVSVSYEGANVIYVKANAPKEESTDTSANSASKPQNDSEAQTEDGSNASEQVESTQQAASEQAGDSQTSATDKAKGTLGSLVDAAATAVVTPEFKEMMDGYEAFMDSYCDFMVKYTNTADSGDSASLAAMMGDYTSV